MIGEAREDFRKETLTPVWSWKVEQSGLKWDNCQNFHRGCAGMETDGWEDTGGGISQAFQRWHHMTGGHQCLKKGNESLRT